jgi:hypothetical protein
MAESKSTKFSFAINDHSEKILKFQPVSDQRVRGRIQNAQRTSQCRRLAARFGAVMAEWYARMRNWTSNSAEQRACSGLGS